ncbi:SAM-dependent methyltransferase [Actinomadura viridis]|uniref:SAM-dependent methyltransferase n=1 Tax=Actinomadura viridis TaxID=58110 RepID=UPI0036AA74D8
MPQDPPPPVGVDISRASPARMFDYALGGHDNFEVDRIAAESILKVAPSLRELARHDRAFVHRAVRYLCDQGIDQFIDIGSGLPTQENVHQVAMRCNPQARVVYVDNDPIVNAHGRALLGTSPTTAFVLADAREPDAIMNAPETRGLIDFDRPVGVLMTGLLHFIADDQRPAEVVSQIASHLPSASGIAIVHVCRDHTQPAALGQLEAVYQNATAQIQIRSRAHIERLLAGMDLVPPGWVDVQDWRTSEDEQPGQVRALAAIGRVR